jgi:hypothetical protein
MPRRSFSTTGLLPPLKKKATTKDDDKKANIATAKEHAKALKKIAESKKKANLVQKN